MGKCKEHPRYNISSVRVSDEHLAKIEELRGTQPRSVIILTAIEELVRREEAAACRGQVERDLGR